MKSADFLTALVQKANSLSEVNEVLERIERLAVALRTAQPGSIEKVQEVATTGKAAKIPYRGGARVYAKAEGKPANHGYEWTYREKLILKAMHADNLSDSEMAKRLKRTEAAVMVQRYKMGLYRLPGVATATPAQGDLQLNGAAG